MSYALLRRYDKELMAKAEELEDLRRRLQARIAELEDHAEQARVRASKMEKEKNRLATEVREITIELENVSESTQILFIIFLEDIAHKVKPIVM